MTTAALAARVRAASGDSLVARGIARSLTAITLPMRPRVDVQSWDDETVWFTGEIAGTRVGRAAAGVIGVIARAWQDASARKVVNGAVERMTGLAPSERIRVIGIWAVIAAATDGLLTPFDPRPASIARWVLWGAVLVLGATAIVLSERTAAAWTEWRARRLPGRQNT